MLLQAADDVAQRAFACFLRGCARIATGHLPGGAHAVVVVGNDGDVHGAAAARGRAQFRQNQRLERRFCLRQLLGFCPRRLVGHGPLLKRAAATFEHERILCACRAPVPRTRCAPLPPCGRGSRPSLLIAPISEPETDLKTWAAAGGARAPAFSAWGSSLRAAPVSSQPCARAGWLPTSRGSCARTVFRTPCGASSH